jgi:hypothetical protein
MRKKDYLILREVMILMKRSQKRVLLKLKSSLLRMRVLQKLKRSLKIPMMDLITNECSVSFSVNVFFGGEEF